MPATHEDRFSNKPQATFDKMHICNNIGATTGVRDERWGTVLELVLSDDQVTPKVELLDGPRVRLTISASENLSHGIEFCRAELSQAVEAALGQLHQDETATARIFVRDADGTQIIATSDPCTTYGSQAIVRS